MRPSQHKKNDHGKSLVGKKNKVKLSFSPHQQQYNSGHFTVSILSCVLFVQDVTVPFVFNFRKVWHTARCKQRNTMTDNSSYLPCHTDTHTLTNTTNEAIPPLHSAL